MVFRIFRRDRAPARPRRLVIVRRQAPDWGHIDETYWRDVAAFEKLVFLAPGDMRRLIDRWDAVARIGFFEFRRRVAEITNANFGRVAGADVLDLATFRGGSYDPEAIYAFSDDDDWYAPTLAEALTTTEIAHVGVSWRATEYRGTLEVRAVDGIIATNNYAILGSALARSARLTKLVEQHFDLNNAVAAGKVKVPQIDQRLSVTNKHPASAVVLVQLRNRLGSDAPRHAIDQAKARLKESEPDLAAAGLPWAGAEIAAMRALVEAV